jgi:hypothetical protein
MSLHNSVSVFDCRVEAIDKLIPIKTEFTVDLVTEIYSLRSIRWVTYVGARFAAPRLPKPSIVDL